MAQYQIKAGGPTRGRKRIRMIGMGSGKNVLRRRGSSAAKRRKKR